MDDTTTADAITRLRRVEGQVAGIIRMIEAERQCSDVVTQISAAARALEQVGFKLVASGLRHCLVDPQGAEQQGYTEAELERLFLKLS
jgi:DNA-binding FrmR family transcriptional regulator